MTPAPVGLLALTRPGFEVECATELEALAAAVAARATARVEPHSGRVMLEAADARSAERLAARAGVDETVFARQLVVVRTVVRDLPRGARVEALVDAAAAHGPFAGPVLVEHADDDSGRRLAGLANALVAPLTGALGRAGLLVEDPARHRLHVVVLDTATCVVATSAPGRASPWPGGVPRLRLPGRAPSRSARKLEEALACLLPPAVVERELGPGTVAVDLGAAPGGWSWVLASRGARVIAVDRGPLKGAAAEAPSIEHRRVDAFTFRPEARVDWLVCDVVDKPARVTELLAGWLREGRLRAMVFNLKLPMRQRHAAVEACRARLEAATAAGAVEGTLRLKQLFHDREEVTGAWWSAERGRARRATPRPVRRRRRS
ncbi:MAG: 23S rRNA (cytidine(2498)-2'-O)-methyltransferase RlmM [Chromatiales bacterium]|nr:23S rRNA (cytidine(2498)-2'-O)-methyltransferase RlmM [Chromatiales bacterium]